MLLDVEAPGFVRFALSAAGWLMGALVGFSLAVLSTVTVSLLGHNPP
jgi:uncharacterized membrane protein required for colicin V production